MSVPRVGGWGILNLHNFNLALMGKWWWKFYKDHNWCGMKVVQFNYGLSRWNLFPQLSGRISFFLERDCQQFTDF